MNHSMRALEIANEVRFARVDVKRAMKAGELSLGEALEAPCMGRMTVYGLVCALPRYGPTRAGTLLKACQLSGHRRVADLTDRQRDLLVRAQRGEVLEFA